MSFVYSLQDVRLSLERINDIHTIGDEEAACGGLTGYDGVKSLSLRGVCFRYDPHALSDTVSGITFEIPPGRVTAIVGASGSGKTTLLKLMLGYYPLRAFFCTIQITVHSYCNKTCSNEETHIEFAKVTKVE